MSKAEASGDSSAQFRLDYSTYRVHLQGQRTLSSKFLKYRVGLQGHRRPEGPEILDHRVNSRVQALPLKVSDEHQFGLQGDNRRWDSLKETKEGDTTNDQSVRGWELMSLNKEKRVNKARYSTISYYEYCTSLTCESMSRHSTHFQSFVCLKFPIAHTK
jgi:hypothetical protein